MTTDSAPKRKHRTRRPVLIGITVGFVLLVVCNATMFHEKGDNQLSLMQDTWMCTRCGLQTRTTTYWFFGSKSTRSKILLDPILPNPHEVYSHTPDQIGSRFWTVQIKPWKTAHAKAGFPAGDAFYQNPTLVAAIRKVASTNLYRAEGMLNDLYRLRAKKVDLSKILPSLQTKDAESLIVELKGQKFNEAVMSN